MYFLSSSLFPIALPVATTTVLSGFVCLRLCTTFICLCFANKEDELPLLPCTVVCEAAFPLALKLQ